MKHETRKASQAASAFLNRLSPGKRRAAARLLQLYVGEVVTLDEFDWKSVSRATLIHARSRLSAKYSPSTVNSVLSCVRSLLRNGLREGLLQPQHYLDALEVTGIDRKRPTPSLELTPETLGLLFRACDNDRQAVGRRDAFLLLMIACAGFDRREIVALRDLQRPHRAEGRLFVAKVHHGGGRCSLVLGERAREIVSAWIDVRGTLPGPVVCTIRDGSSVLPAEAVSEQLTYRVVQKRAREAPIGQISTTALKWYYRLHLPGQMRRVDFLLPSHVRHVLEPPT